MKKMSKKIKIKKRNIAQEFFDTLYPDTKEKNIANIIFFMGKMSYALKNKKERIRVADEFDMNEIKNKILNEYAKDLAYCYGPNGPIRPEGFKEAIETVRNNEVEVIFLLGRDFSFHLDEENIYSFTVKLQYV